MVAPPGACQECSIYWKCAGSISSSDNDLVPHWACSVCTCSRNGYKKKQHKLCYAQYLQTVASGNWRTQFVIVLPSFPAQTEYITTPISPHSKMHCNLLPVCNPFLGAKPTLFSLSSLGVTAKAGLACGAECQSEAGRTWPRINGLCWRPLDPYDKVMKERHMAGVQPGRARGPPCLTNPLCARWTDGASIQKKTFGGGSSAHI